MSSTGSLKTGARADTDQSEIDGREPECSLPLVCIHLGLTPCVRGVAVRSGCLSLGDIVTTRGEGEMVAESKGLFTRVSRVL